MVFRAALVESVAEAECRMKNPKTTIGGIVIVAALGMMWTHAVDVPTAMSLIGLAGAWIGVAARDGQDGGAGK